MAVIQANKETKNERNAESGILVLYLRNST